MIFLASNVHSSEVRDIDEMEQQTTETTQARPNRRRQPRIPTNGRITVYLEDGRGKRRSVEVRVLDASRTGILVQSDHPIPAGTVGFLQAATFPLSGKTTVRYCRQQGLGFRIGLHLPDALISRSLLGETGKNRCSEGKLCPSTPCAP
jgi:hypothetical protein